MVIAVMVAGAVAVAVAWRLIAAKRVSVWVGQGVATGGAAVAALATGRVELSPRVEWWLAALAGLGTGLALYGATFAFVVVVARWVRFDRHVAEIYGQAGGRSLLVTLVLAAGLVAPGEEVFWRGLFQGRLADATTWPAGAALTWFAYAMANAASGSLPIIAGAVVSGAIWGALALWTHGVLASLVCHSSWTALMIAAPPRRRDRPTDPPARRAGR